jgi:hypothetical protein
MVLHGGFNLQVQVGMLALAAAGNRYGTIGCLPFFPMWPMENDDERTR